MVRILAGAGRRHDALASRVSALFETNSGAQAVSRLPGRPKVRVLATGKATYPDASVVCLVACGG